MNFFETLSAETQSERAALLAVPQIRDGLAGRISLATYVAYLTEAFHHVRHTAPLLASTRAALPATHAAFTTALDQYIAEEAGHENWILSDIAHCGADDVAAQKSDPRPATEVMVAFVYDYIRRVNPMGMFGMVFVLEGTSVALASIGAEALAKSLRLPPSCFTYLTSHGALDQEHMAFFARLMDAVEDPGDRAAIIHVAKRVYYLFGEMFRSIPHEIGMAHAA